MPHYQVFARKYRPQTFREVLGQDAVVTTLKNAIQRGSLAHAYLFCGGRGTGKTTLARVFAKALNCTQRTAEGEPCNQCASCKEISAGNSMDVLEIDGASHRGIDDIRQINENVGYAPAGGQYKIYIIDEVHMLTKEAFNALLKTLEEPPPKVLFFFATTEPQKVLPTILSRCQRFHLRRLTIPCIFGKLQGIARDLHMDVEEEALRLLAAYAEGGMRDAESLFDQVVSFHAGAISAETVREVLGLMPRAVFFALDRAGKEGRLSAAFEIADQVFSQGKDLTYFLESLMEHYRCLLLTKVAGEGSPVLQLLDEERQAYKDSAMLYTQEQCLTIIDLLMEAQRYKSTASFGKIALEALLLRILRIHQRIPVDLLVQRLAEIEGKITSSPSSPSPAAYAIPPVEKQKHVTEDPTPTLRDLEHRTKSAPPPPPIPPAAAAPSSSAPVELGARPTEEAVQEKRQQQSRLDTLLQFAAVELDGNLKKKSFLR